MAPHSQLPMKALCCYCLYLHLLQMQSMLVSLSLGGEVMELHVLWHLVASKLKHIKGRHS